MNLLNITILILFNLQAILAGNCLKGGHTHEQPQQAAHPGHVSPDRGGHVTGIGKFCIKICSWYYDEASTSQGPIKRHGKEIAGTSSSHKTLASSTRCHCKKYSGNQFNPEQIISSKKHGDIPLFVNMNEKIGSGGFGNIYHAYWQKGKKCVALKILNLTKEGSNKKSTALENAANNEIKVLEYFDNLPDANFPAANVKDFVIKIYGHEEQTGDDNKPKMFIVLELEGINLLQYYSTIINDDEKITNMLIFAAEALHNFHKRKIINITNCRINKDAIHLDIKPSNFVIPLDNMSNRDISLSSCKLIDFGSSVIAKDIDEVNIKGKIGTEEYMSPEIRYATPAQVTRKADMFSFGAMIYKLLHSPNEKFENVDLNLIGYEKLLDRIIRACISEEPSHRPSAFAIYAFLKGMCNSFAYENVTNGIICPENGEIRQD
uniref:Protein kinase domain-containing protein n=1 Tax=Meloidogyne javanica TaxID=6303 RepID=A0A915M6G6_MELJA